MLRGELQGRVRTVIAQVAEEMNIKIVNGVVQEFPELKQRYWGKHFWARGYFSATSGNVTDDVIDAYISNHYDAHQQHDEENISLE